MPKAIGMVEYFNVTTGVQAADIMAKTADVDIITAMTVCPGKYIVIVSGALSAVKAAVDAAKTHFPAKLVDSFILGNPHEDIFPAIYGSSGPGEVAAVEAAIEKAKQAIKEEGTYLDSAVIARPTKEIWKSIL